MRPTTLGWLTQSRPTGVTWGVPWPRGAVAPESLFALRSQAAEVPVQSWVTATWPDGSVKWSAHAIGPQPDPAFSYELVPGSTPVSGEHVVRITEAEDSLTVDTGLVGWILPRSGPLLIRTAVRDGREIVRDVRLVSLWQGEPTPDDAGTVTRHEMHGHVTTVTVEQAGPVRAVIRLEGRHQPASRTEAATRAEAATRDGQRETAARAEAAARDGQRETAGHGAEPDSFDEAAAGAGAADGRPGAGARAWLPFTVRLYFYAGAEEVRVVHTFVWDGEAERDFLAGLGLRAGVAMRDEPHDRHVRLAGPAGADHRPGFLTEAVRGITGLRRDPGERFRLAQVAGRGCGPVEQWAQTVSGRAHLIPQWTDWTLDQASADGFTLRKRTGPGSAWVTIPASTRAAGYGYVGGVGGGLGFGLRDFWKLHPTRLDIRGAATPTATATVWMWSPSAPAMDLRFYHDGLGQQDYAEQLEGLEITYEDYEPGFGTPHGIARTHEMVLRAYAGTPSADRLAEHAAALNDPALLVCSPQRLREAGVFGDWMPADRSSPARAQIEDRLDFLFGFYTGQQEQRRWYGFWDYGDVMHTYDPDRHQWRYDIGGYAWDNSELSPDLWLWNQFLRTGRADVFRFAEAMTRHTGEVDVYHLGRWKGLGTRHNVQHWGCSAKQLRISSAIYRRHYYYLTADERVGELLDELAEAERTFLEIDPTRKVRTDVYTPDRNALAVGLGTDWGALAAAWLTKWERTGDEAARDKLLGTMAGIGALPQGFLTGEALLDLDTGRFDTTRDQIAVSHLSAVFGLAEVCSELIALQEVPGFKDAWLRYCEIYLASPEEQEAAVGHRLTGISLIQAHSRLAAYAAAHLDDEALANTAWRAFRHDIGDQLNSNPLQRQEHWAITQVTGPDVLAPIDEAAFVSTNDASQYGLAAIQNLALIGSLCDESGRAPR